MNLAGRKAFNRQQDNRFSTEPDLRRADGEGPMNRLKDASSPYLLQHRDNPVHWWEWGPEAFAEARAANKPVLISIGYAACHWCHVMAHESFEDEAVAAVMNDLFVNIKVDREERPDVDHVYMSALHALGEQGGWPLTMFLTPEGEPFWGGTYFPKEPRFGRPGFVQILHEISRIHRSEPERIRHNAQALKQHLAGTDAEADGGTLALSDLDNLGSRLAGIFDAENGGLQGAPKFPNPPILEFLLRYARRRQDATAQSRFLLTLERMALGGIHDHLGGGFARYSVDERWLVPHFEKMLYDNAQLLELYGLAHAQTGRPLFRAAAEGIVAWLAREMTLPGGAFASSLDADSEGEEGRFYVWSAGEVRAALGEDADLFCRIYDITEAGNWEGANIPNRLLTGEAPPAVEEHLHTMRAKLLDRRAARPRPGLDDKVLADWNGLMIAALVRAGLLMDHPEWVDTARTAYRFIAESMTRGGRLGHSWRAGSLIFPGFALDHAAMMRAALALYEAGGEGSFLRDAQTWRDILLTDYRVEDAGILAMTAQESDPLVVRPQPTHDDAVPNANGVFVEALVRLAHITGTAADHRQAEDVLTRLVGVARAAPLGHTSILNALDLHLRGVSILVAGDATEALHASALRLPYLDRSVRRLAANDDLDQNHPAHGLAASGAGARALVCAGMRCSLPVTDPDELQARVDEMQAG
jgi:uncharacterized protein